MSSPQAFPPTANPAGYVASAGSEQALADLERWALASRKPLCVLRGPPGMGKTLLLKLFAARMQHAFETAFVPHPDCDPDGLCRAVLAALGAAPAEDPRAGLAQALKARRPLGARLLIAIDEADFLPRETAIWLIDLAGSSGGAVRVLLAMTDGTERAGPVAVLGVESETVRLDAAMSRRELEAYVHGELERAGVDRAISARFDPSALAELYARSGGIPGALRREATGMLFRAELARGAPAAAPALPPDARAEPPQVELPLPEPGRAALAHAPGLSAERPSRRTGHLVAAGVGVAAGLALAWGLAGSRGGSPATPPASRAVEAASLPAPRATSTTPRVDVAAAPHPAERAATHPAEPAATHPAALAAPPRTAEPPRAPPPAVAPVFVHVNASPWAEIELDGQPVGETPIARLAVLPGRHRLAARMPDGRVLARDVNIRESGTRIVFP
jgi:AAA domain